MTSSPRSTLLFLFQAALLLWRLPAVSSFQVCKKVRQMPDRQGREGFALAPMPLNSSDAIAIGRDPNNTMATAYADDFLLFGGEARDYENDAIQHFKWRNRKAKPLTELWSQLPTHLFSGSSVQRVRSDLYLLVADSTQSDFWLWNYTSQKLTTISGFPRPGLERFCLMYSVLHQTAVITGGNSEDASNNAATYAWLTLNISDEALSNATGMRWLEQSTEVPFQRRGHQCCVLGDDGLVFGGFTKKGDKRPSKQTHVLDFSDMTWTKIKTKKRKIVTAFKGEFFRSYGMCVTDAIDFESQSSSLRAWLVGGKTNKSHTNRAVVRVKYKKNKRVVLHLGRNMPCNEDSGCVFLTRKQHIRPGAVMLNDTIYLLGGENKKHGLSDRFERLNVKCANTRKHFLMNPLKDVFGIPYYVLYPLGTLSGVFMRYLMRLLFVVSCKCCAPKKVAADIQSLHENAVIDALTLFQGFPLEVASLLVGFTEASSPSVVRYARWKKWRIGAGNVVPKMLDSTKAMLNIVTLALGLWFYGKLVADMKSPWHQSCSLWLWLFSHPFLKYGFDVFVNIVLRSGYDRVDDSHIYFLSTMAVAVFFACVSVTVSVPSFFVFFAPCGILLGAAAMGLEFLLLDSWNDALKEFGDWRRDLANQCAAAFVWALGLAAMRVMFVAFGTLCTRKGWGLALWYGIQGKDIQHFAFDVYDWRAYVFLFAWLL